MRSAPMAESRLIRVEWTLAPETGAPIVECGWVFRPRRAVVRRFEWVRIQDRAPRRVQRLVRRRRPHISGKALFDCAKLSDVFLSLDQRDLVLAAGQRRPAKLRQIVLPEADEANIVGAWGFVEDQV